MIKGHVHFERVEALGRLSADVAGKGAAGILVQVANVRLEHVGPREGLPAEQAADQAWKNKGQKHERQGKYTRSTARKNLYTKNFMRIVLGKRKTYHHI